MTNEQKLRALVEQMMPGRLVTFDAIYDVALAVPTMLACVEALRELGPRTHYFCEDSWYSCPKADDGCANDRAGTDCNCGADAHNAKVEAALAAFDALEIKEVKRAE